ncbi:helix-turn-helix domain-containing protein [Bacillus sp. REN10]|uniref:helix-turn-helix domain-containing protein n=1 Tax=Bacillus sp. REN10 TaxID=2782541 RepID=UPI00193C6693
MDHKTLSGLLNPIRMRILQTLLGKEMITTRMIAEQLPDIPQASLYRHINKLVKDGILEICEENKIRGTVEKVYRLKANPFQQIQEAAEQGGREEHFQLFYTFAMSLLMDFQQYVNIEDYNMEQDRVGFRSYPFYLSDEECDMFLEEIKQALIKVAGKEPNDQRTLRKFSFTMMPAKEE